VAVKASEARNALSHGRCIGIPPNSSSRTLGDRAQRVNHYAKCLGDPYPAVPDSGHAGETSGLDSSTSRWPGGKDPCIDPAGARGAWSAGRRWPIFLAVPDGIYGQELIIEEIAHDVVNRRTTAACRSRRVGQPFFGFGTHRSLAGDLAAGGVLRKPVGELVELLFEAGCCSRRGAFLLGPSGSIAYVAHGDMHRCNGARPSSDARP
jgi:hypothetical protein